MPLSVFTLTPGDEIRELDAQASDCMRTRKPPDTVVLQVYADNHVALEGSRRVAATS